MVHIVQCLCPSRHCIMAISYDPAGPNSQIKTPEEGIETLKRMVDTAINGLLVDPWCGICKSRTFSYEDGETRWRTLEEARPYLEASEAEQANVRRQLRARHN